MRHRPFLRREPLLLRKLPHLHPLHLDCRQLTATLRRRRLTRTANVQRTLSDAGGDAPTTQPISDWTATQLGQFIEQTVASATARALHQALSPSASERRTPTVPRTPSATTPRALSTSASQQQQPLSPSQPLPQTPPPATHVEDDDDNIQDVSDTDSSVSSLGLQPSLPLSPANPTATATATRATRRAAARHAAQEEGKEDDNVEEAVRMEEPVSGRGPNLATWSVTDLQRFLQQQIRDGRVAVEERAALELPFDPDEEVQAPYVEELRERALMLPRLATTFSATPQSERQDSEDDQHPVPTWQEAVMTASQNKVVKALMGKWQTPTHFERLDAETSDFDWWFREMHLHLDSCCITRQEYWMHFYRLHCQPEFWRSIRARLRSEGITPYKIMHHPHKFQEYVCLRYTRPTYADEIRQRIFALNKRKLPTSEAWREISKLIYCYNEFMRRTKGTPYSDAEHSTYFINTLHEPLFQHLNHLLLQQHPSVRTADDTHLAALAFERSQAIRAGTLGDVVPDAVMTAPPSAMPTATTTAAVPAAAAATAAAGSRGRRGGKAGKRAAKRRQETGVGQATAAIAATPQAAPPPPPPASGRGTPPPPATPMTIPQPAVVATAPLNCPRCGGDHFVANCPTRFQNSRSPRKPQQQHQQQQNSPASQSQQRRPSNGLRCTYCGKDGHLEDRCWLQYPYKRPAKFTQQFQQPRQPAAKETAAVAMVTPAGGAEIATPAAPQPVRWTHLAAPPPNNNQQSFVMIAMSCSASAGRDRQIVLPATELQMHQQQRRRAQLTTTSPRRSAATPSDAATRYACAALTPVNDMCLASACRCLLRIETQYAGRPFQMIVDTGATVNLVRRDKLDVTVTYQEVEPLSIRDVRGGTSSLSQQTTLLFDINSHPYAFDFYVCDTIPADAILGIDAIIEAGWIVDVFNRCLYHATHALPPVPLAPCHHTAKLAYAAAAFVLPPRTWKAVRVTWTGATAPKEGGGLVLLTPTTPIESPVHGAPSVVEENAALKYVLLCNNGGDTLYIDVDSPVAYREECQEVKGEKEAKEEKGNKKEAKVKPSKVEEVFNMAQVKANWSPQHITHLKRLLREWQHVWECPETLGRTGKGEHRVDTGMAPPIAQPLRRAAWAEKDFIQGEVQKMKKQKIVVESESPWSSPPVLVKKKDGSVRFCVDYRKLNEVTTPDQYPLPRIDDVLDALENGRYFSVIDLKSGYWQIPMKAEDAEKTAFRTADGLFHFTVMPFGLRNAPATFQRLMDVVFSGLKWQGLLVYMDDIIVYSSTAERHLFLLEQVMTRLSDAGLKINPKKTTLVAMEVSYLGHVVSAQGVKPDPKKVAAVQQLSPPRNVREVRSFLGLAGYYRRFIDAFAAVAVPLYELTKKDVTFAWEDRHQKAFDILKQRLCSAPVLAYPRRERSFVLDCDASDDAAGAVLMQIDEDGNEVVIQYASYTFQVQREGGR